VFDGKGESGGKVVKWMKKGRRSREEEREETSVYVK
jgi:hypothetical protein